MRFLADTHAFLWFVFGDPRLSAKAEKLLGDPAAQPVLSAVSLWEIAVKVSIGKLKLGREYGDFVDEFVLRRDVEMLAIEVAHLKEYPVLPMYHRDPFDRLLIAQARTESLPIVTDDSAFKSYHVKTIW